MKRGKQNQPSCEIKWSVLPNEIEDNILSRLPVKSLIRFRCVCKHWCNLVSSPRFIKMHLNRSTEIEEDPKFVRAYNGKVYFIDVEACQNHKTRKHEKNKLESELVLPFTVPSPGFLLKVSGSCNGLLCLSAFDGLHLLNPATKEYKRLPYPKEDAYYTARVFGFGYSPRTDEYKVVMIYGTIGLYWDDVYVYTLGMNSSWRSIGRIKYRIESADTNHHALVNGALHWMARTVSMVPISFDIGDEEFRELSLPKSLEDTNVHMGLGELGGFLSLYHRRNDRNTHEIWVMKDYGDEQSWIKVFSFTLPIVTGLLKPLYILEEDVVLCESDFKFFILDVVTMRRLPLKRLPSNSDAVMYFESLVSLSVDGEMDRGNKRERRENEGRRLALDAICDLLVQWSEVKQMKHYSPTWKSRPNQIARQSQIGVKEVLLSP